MLYLISLYYRKNIVTGANKRFDEIGKRILSSVGVNEMSLIVADGECPNWFPENNVHYISKFSSRLERIKSNIELSSLLHKLDSGILISDFLPLPIWGLDKHKHFQLIHDLRSFTSYSRSNIGFLTSYLQARSLRKSQQIIAVSEFSKRDVVELCRIEPEQVIVSYNGVNVDNYVADLVNERNIDYTYVATFEPRKNHKRLLYALKNISVPLSVVFVGRDLGEKESLLPLINEINDSSHVKIKVIESTSDKELIDLYNNTKTFISPSMLEGFGMPLIEAALCGCRIACSNLDVFKEILGSHATYFDPSSVEQISIAINDLNNKKFSVDNKVITYVYEQFSWNSITEQLLNDINVSY